MFDSGEDDVDVHPVEAVDCGFERIVVGAAVKPVFKPAEDGNLVPMFGLRD